MTSAFSIPRRKLYQAVRDSLLDRIRAREFRPGDQLPSERDLMQTYGVGRPAVREALQALERDGIVSITHGERARVTMPTAEKLIEQIAGSAGHLLRVEPSNLDHLKDARLFLETGLAQRAAANATPEAVEKLRQRFEAHQRARQELDEFLPRDMAFSSRDCRDDRQSDLSFSDRGHVWLVERVLRSAGEGRGCGGHHDCRASANPRSDRRGRQGRRRQSYARTHFTR